jgi:hypothetical protein
MQWKYIGTMDGKIASVTWQLRAPRRPASTDFLAPLIFRKQ